MSKSTQSRRFVIRPDAFNPGYFEIYDLAEHRVVSTVRGLTDANRRARHLNVNPPKPSAPAGFIDTICQGCKAAIYVEAGATPLCSKCATWLNECIDESNKARELCHETWLGEPSPTEREEIESLAAQMDAAERVPGESVTIRITVPAYCD